MRLRWLVGLALCGCYAAHERPESSPRDASLPDASLEPRDTGLRDARPDAPNDGGEDPLVERCEPSDLVEPDLPLGALRSDTVDASAWRPLPTRAECCDLVTRATIGDPEGRVASSRMAARGDGTFYVAWEIGRHEDWTRELVVARIDEEGRVVAGPRSLGAWRVTGLAAHGSRALLSANRATSRGGIFEGHLFALDENLSVCEPFAHEDNVLYFDVARHVAGHGWAVVKARGSWTRASDYVLQLRDDALRVIREVPLREIAERYVRLLTSGAYLVTVFPDDLHVHVDADLRSVGSLPFEGALAAFRDELITFTSDVGWFAIDLPTLTARPLPADVDFPSPRWALNRFLEADHVLGTIFSNHVVFAGDGRWLATAVALPTAGDNEIALEPGTMFVFGAGTNLGSLPRGARVDVARLRNVE